MPLEQVIWVSAAVKPFSADELVRLLERSRPASLGAEPGTVCSTIKIHSCS